MNHQKQTMKRWLSMWTGLAALVVLLNGSASAADYTVDITAPNGWKKLPEDWNRYFGVHYTQDDPYPAATPRVAYWSTVRWFGGPKVDLLDDSNPASPQSVGPFWLTPLRIGPDDIGGNNGTLENNILGVLDDYDQQYRMQTIYGPITKFIPADKDRTYVMVKTTHQPNPSADPIPAEQVVWEIGNEINTEFYMPVPPPLNTSTNITDAPFIPSWWGGTSGTTIYPFGDLSGYENPGKIALYVNGLLGPQLQAIRKVSKELYGDEHAIKVSLANIAGASRDTTTNPSRDEWYDELLNTTVSANLVYTDNSGIQRTIYNVTGDLPNYQIVGKKVRELVDYIAIHYALARYDDEAGYGYNTQARLNHYYDSYVTNSSVIRGVWNTEEHGWGGKGPADIFLAAMRYIEWISGRQLTSDQARLCWWGTGDGNDPETGMVGVKILAEWLHGVVGTTGNTYIYRIGTQASTNALITKFYIYDNSIGACDRMLVVLRPLTRQSKLSIRNVTIVRPSWVPSSGWTAELYATSWDTSSSAIKKVASTAMTTDTNAWCYYSGNQFIFKVYSSNQDQDGPVAIFMKR